jgi:hypothetical protein
LALADGSVVAVCESHDGHHVNLSITNRDGSDVLARAGVDLDLDDAHTVATLISTAVRRLKKDAPDPE